MESDPLPTADSTGLEGPTHLAKRVGEDHVHAPQSKPVYLNLPNPDGT